MFGDYVYKTTQQNTKLVEIVHKILINHIVVNIIL